MSADAVQEQGQRTDVVEGAPNETGLSAGRSDKPLSRTEAIGFGLAPRNFDEAWRMAGIITKTKLVPPVYQNNPEGALVAMLYGAEIGLPPMASLQSVAVINGKPGVYGDGFLGVIQSKPAYAKHKEYYELRDGTQLTGLRQAHFDDDETKAVSIFWRKGNPEPFTAEFSIGDAKRAKLWTKEGPWTNYPARQLLWRARGFAGRNGFAAELRGIKMAEELLDTPEDDAPLSPGYQTLQGPPAEPIRLSAKQLQEAPAPASDAAPAPPTNQVQPQPSGDNGAQKPVGGGKTAAAAADPKLEEFKQVGPGQVLKHVRITNTAMVVDNAKQGGGTRYEIQGDTGEGKAGITQTWVTRDEQLYRAAASCEGTESRFNVTWHTAKTKDQKREFKVITGLEGN